MPEQGKTRAEPSDGQRPRRFARAALMMVGSSALIAVTSLLAKALGRDVSGSALISLEVRSVL
jgi:hypothetical protein